MAEVIHCPLPILAAFGRGTFLPMLRVLDISLLGSLFLLIRYDSVCVHACVHRHHCVCIIQAYLIGVVWACYKYLAQYHVTTTDTGLASFDADNSGQVSGHPVIFLDRLM